MLDVWEAGIVGHGHVAERMAFAAVRRGSGSKSGGTVMAGPARFALPHFRHGITFPLRPGTENPVVAVAATIELTMETVAESDRPGRRSLEFDIVGLDVTFVAVAVDAEDGFPFMTDAAGESFFHVGHRIALTVDATDEDSAVAVVAIEDFRMDTVAEEGVALAEGHLPDVSVAFAAVTFDGKGGIAVVAATARLLGLHLFHGIATAVRPGDEIPAMTVGAIVAEPEVVIMAEMRIGGEGDIPDHMTLGAVRLDGESGCAVMAGTAGCPFFHLGHRRMGIVGTRLEDGVVAVCAAISAKAHVEAMTEGYGTEIGDADRHFLGDMATDAFGQREGPFAVMAGTAGLPLLHFRHGNRRGLLADGEQGVMAQGAITAERLEMERMLEDDLAGIIRRECDDPVIGGKQDDGQQKQQNGGNQQAFHDQLLGWPSFIHPLGERQRLRNCGGSGLPA